MMTRTDRSTPTYTFKQLVEVMLGPAPQGRAADEFIRRCHQMGLAYLRRRARVGRLDAEMFGVSVDDLALDCVAELFRRDDAGAYVQLRSYFNGIAWQRDDDAAVEMAVRRIVFSAVNEGLFRRYREWDPSLGRLIRTFKRHIKRSDVLELQRSRSVLVVSLRDAGAEALARPLMPSEVLEGHLHHATGGTPTPADLLDALAGVLQANDHYAPMVMLTDLALVVRSVFTRLNAVEGDDTVHEDRAYEEKDLAEIVRGHIDHCMGDVRENMETFYVERRGIAPSLYAAYFSAVRDTLVGQYVDADAPRDSLRVALSRYTGEIASVDYRREHQAVLEYLVKLTQTRLLRRVASLV